MSFQESVNSSNLSCLRMTWLNVVGERDYLGQQRKPLRTPPFWAAPCQELCLRWILCMRGIWVSLKGARVPASARQESRNEGEA